MDLKKVKPSERFYDRTGDSVVRKGMNAFLMDANPVVLMRKVRDKQIQEGKLLPPETSPFGPTNVKQLMLNEMLLRLMRNDDLINPQVVQSGMYGDLIPEDRWDKMGYPSRKKSK